MWSEEPINRQTQWKSWRNEILWYRIQLPCSARPGGLGKPVCTACPLGSLNIAASCSARRGQTRGTDAVSGEPWCEPWHKPSGLCGSKDGGRQWWLLLLASPWYPDACSGTEISAFGKQQNFKMFWTLSFACLCQLFFPHLKSLMAF